MAKRKVCRPVTVTRKKTAANKVATRRRKNGGKSRVRRLSAAQRKRHGTARWGVFTC